jgi:hypothetical protein
MTVKWQDWFLTPRQLNRLLLSLSLVNQYPNSVFALRYAVYNINPYSKYAQRLEQHYRGLSDNNRDLLLEEENVRYSASQLVLDYQFIKDVRWGLVTGLWGLILSSVAGVISGVIVARS